MSPVTGRLEKDRVRLSEPVTWADGQRVVVIPLPPAPASGAEPFVPPPLDLLEEDAAEFSRRPETLGPMNRSELE